MVVIIGVTIGGMIFVVRDWAIKVAILVHSITAGDQIVHLS